MTRMRMRRLSLLMLPVVAVVGGIVGATLRSANADGVPATNPLYYSGRLLESGVPANGTRTIVVDLWDDATSADISRRKCETVTPAAPVSNGLFRVALDPTCVAAINQTRDLWSEVFVGSTSLGRRKVGAVPYALQAGHAADVPPSALVLPSSLITSTTGNLADFRNNATVSVAGKWTDIPGRSLAFTKRYATSKLKITYQDTLGVLGRFYAGCEWQFLIDGAPIAFFSHADADNSADVWRMANGPHLAWASPAAGNHVVSVQNRGNASRGAWATGTQECLQGWNTTGNFLSVEEIP